MSTERAVDEQFVVVDRYSATGIPRPDPETVCQGQCEGMGCVPVQADDEDPVLRALWHEAHFQANHECDGWHFVTCPACNGSGNRPAGTP